MPRYGGLIGWRLSGPYIYGPRSHGDNMSHLGEGPMARIRLSIDKITSPSFRFHVRDPRDPGLRIAATVRMMREEVRELEVGAFMYVILWDHRMEVQIEVVAADDARGDPSERGRDSASRPAVFLEHVRGLLGQGVSARSSRGPRPSSSGVRPTASFRGPSPRPGLLNELLNQAQTEEASYNALVIMNESLAGAGHGPPSGSSHGLPLTSSLLNELLNQAQTEEASYNTLVDNALDESFVAGAGRAPRPSGGHPRPSRSGSSRSQSGPSRQRQPVEGNCSICLASLSSQQNLVWCEARCGQNFHSNCLHHWLDSQYEARMEGLPAAHACPNCRAVWVQSPPRD